MLKTLRLLPFAFGTLILSGHCEAQGRAAKRAQELKPHVYANLGQIMRGIMFPASNVIFSVQQENPADVSSKRDPSTSTDVLDGSYGRWEAVENSALAIAEAANLLNLPGRKCINGRDVPVKSPDWPHFVQELRDAAMTTYRAAQTKDRAKVIDASVALNDACANCHNKYRVSNDLLPRDERADFPDRCKSSVSPAR